MKRKIRNLLLLLPGAVSLLLSFLGRFFPEFIERYYSRGIYRGISFVLQHITGPIPFSLFEAGMVLLAVLAVVPMFRGVLFFISRKKQGAGAAFLWAGVKRGLFPLACLLSLLLFGYELTCGMNYNRQTLAETLHLTVRESSVQELKIAAERLAEGARAARSELVSGEDGQVLPAYDSFAEMGEAAKGAVTKLGEKIPAMKGEYPRPKRLLSSELFSRMQTTGIFIGITMEANVNSLPPDYTIPFTMCHELSHLQGFMREEEANYLAFLACILSEEPYLRYSGYMEAFSYAGNRLAARDPEAYREIRGRIFTREMEQDAAANAQYWAQYRDTALSALSDWANDTYLMANGEAAGVESYGLMTDLILAGYRAERERK